MKKPQPADPAKTAAQRWRRDPIAFIREVLINPETGRPFELYPAQVEFIRRAFTVTREGRLPFEELIYSCPKKSGKTATAAMALLYTVVVLGGPYAEGYCVANDFEQASSRVFQAATRIVQASPLLRSATVTNNKIVFSTGASIQAIASDYAGAAGSNPTLTVFDELWGITTERAQRLWDELVPVPTRKVSSRLTVSYAGYEQESALLEGLYKKGLQGEEIAPALYQQPGLLMFWSHEPVAPWQDARWLEQMRGQLRPTAFIRQIENRFVSSETTFIDMELWDRCVDEELSPVLGVQPSLPVWLGLDASVKHDSTAIAVATFDREVRKVRLVTHRIFKPTSDEPIDFEAMIESTVLDLRRRFHVRQILYDPFQMAATSQRLVAAGLPMQEFSQTQPHLTEASQNLYELVKAHNLEVYPDDEIRTAVSRAVAIETPRGWKIGKDKSSARIDIVVALAMACLGAVQQSATGDGAIYPGELMIAPSPRWSQRWRPSREGRESLDREDAPRVTAGSRFGRSRRLGMW